MAPLGDWPDFGDGTPFLECVLVFTAAVYTFETFLELRQVGHTLRVRARARAAATYPPTHLLAMRNSFVCTG